MRHASLFAKGMIGSLELKNRLVMPPMVRNYADAQGRAGARYAAHVERVARGGAGMLILEASFISPEGRGFANQLGIHDDAVIPGIKTLVRVAHRHGAKIGMQLYHAGRQTTSKTTGLPTYAPSAIPDPVSVQVPAEMDAAKIKAVIGEFARAAARAKKAGLDFVEIHGAHGYLITQFLSRFSNRRTDQYGGSFQNRARFLMEVYAAIRKAVGKNYPVLVRLSGEEMVEGGITLEETVRAAKMLEREGVDGLHVSVGNYASYARGYMIAPMAMPDALIVRVAAAVKKAVKIPVIAVGKLRDPKVAAAVLDGRKADFIAIGRTLLADPEWPNKVREGRLDEVNPCIACNQGCISRLFAGQDVWCTVNPETGREQQFAKAPKSKKHFVVVGGGPAGLSAAKTAATRGHRVTLYERTRRLGGQLFAAGAAPHRQGWNELRETLVRDVRRLGVTIRTGIDFVPSTLTGKKPDAVIIAVGSSPMKPKIPGMGRMHVITSRDLLEGRVKPKGKVVVAGGGCAGAQTAEYLAAKHHDVTIIEAGPSLAGDAPMDDRALLLGRLAKLGVKTMTETKVMSIGPSVVVTEGHRGPNTIMADTVVLCLGSYPNDGILEEVRKKVRHVVRVGDAADPRRVTEAVAEGALAVLHAERNS